MSNFVKNANQAAFNKKLLSNGIDLSPSDAQLKTPPSNSRRGPSNSRPLSNTKNRVTPKPTVNARSGWTPKSSGPANPVFGRSQLPSSFNVPGSSNATKPPGSNSSSFLGKENVVSSNSGTFFV